MIKATTNNKQEILQVLEKDLKNNLYMYIDIFKYGLNESFIEVWFNRNRNDVINQIIMRYYDTIHVYSSIPNVSSIISLIKTIKPVMISGKRNNIMSLSNYLIQEYEYTSGMILEQIEETKEYSNEIVLAKPSDINEVAKLIISDKSIGGHYEETSLSNQIRDRNKKNMGRNYIIKNSQGVIIAHLSTYAETETICILGGMIVHEEYRKQGLATMLYKHVSNELLQENKKIFLFAHDNNVIEMYKGMGAKVVSKYGKLTKI